MTRRTLRTRTRTLIAVTSLLAVVGLSACGSDDDSEDQPTTTEAMMDDTTTTEAMMDDTTTTEAMMDDTATTEAMMDATTVP